MFVAMKLVRHSDKGKIINIQETHS
jgi:hypothetical protein